MKNIFLFITTLCITHIGASQYVTKQNNSQTNENFSPYITYAGNFVAQFGDVTYINISPRIGYQFNPKINAGVSLVYIYLKDKFFPPLNGSIWAYGLNGTYDIIQRNEFLPDIFITTEWLFMDRKVAFDIISPSDFKTRRRQFPVFFIGGGGRFHLMGRAYVQISYLYDIVDDPWSPYTNPMLNVGLIIR